MVIGQGGDGVMDGLDDPKVFSNLNEQLGSWEAVGMGDAILCPASICLPPDEG